MRKAANRLADSAAGVGYQNGWDDATANSKERITDLEKMVRELIDVFVPTIRSEMNLTHNQSGAYQRAKALVRRK